MKSILITLAIIGLFVTYLVMGAKQAQIHTENDIRYTELVRENGAYLRVIVCTHSVSAEQHTSEHIESCYNKVEQAENLKLERY